MELQSHPPMSSSQDLSLPMSSEQELPDSPQGPEDGPGEVVDQSTAVKQAPSSQAPADGGSRVEQITEGQVATIAEESPLVAVGPGPTADFSRTPNQGGVDLEIGQAGIMTDDKNGPSAVAAGSKGAVRKEVNLAPENRGTRNDNDSAIVPAMSKHLKTPASNQDVIVGETPETSTMNEVASLEALKTPARNQNVDIETTRQTDPRKNRKQHSTGQERLKRPILENAMTWVLAFGTGIWLISTLVYGWALAITTQNLFQSVTSPPEATRVLRILAEVATVAFNALLAYSAGVVMWATASTKRGVTVSTWLAMSPATDYWGLFRLFFWNQNGKAIDIHRLWIVAR
jgi:hypothetical protein